MDHIEDLRYIKEVMADIKRYDQAARLIEFDQNTVCPEDGMEESGETMVCLRAHIHRRMHEEAFMQAVGNVYECRDSLDVRDRRMIEWLYRDRCRTMDFSSDQDKENKRIKNHALLSWISSRESNDCRSYLESVAEVVETEKNRVSLWRGDDLPEALYDRMLDENERGMRMSILDPLFENCGREVVSLLQDIQKSRKVIRTDFLSRKVSEEQQNKICGFLMDTIGFDKKRGVLAMSESIFTDGIAPDDVRMTTFFDERNFLANMMSIMHEGGHALFEQMLPREDHEHFINQQITQGMHESVSRFYENIIGRSRAFIHYVYPKFCEILPQVFYDVTEQEFYEAVNAVEPSLIRTDADELTYILHIIIRYEIEKELVEGGLRAADLADAWRDKYKKYLGVEPEDDLTGVLQDSHWVDGFGYFPDYALGNFYGASYYRRMQESFDVEKALSCGHIDRVNQWMKENVFARADLLDPADWIKEITGEELSFRPFITYLRRKYEDIYDLSESLSAEDQRIYDYSRRMSRIRMLSSAQIDSISTAEAYRSVLVDNFRTIGKLAADNREIMSSIIDPILEDEDRLSDETIEMIRTISDSLMDVYNRENIDLPVMSMLSERLMKDASRKDDTEYLISQLDAEIDAATSLMIQMRRILTDHSMTEKVRKRGRDALDRLLEFLDRERFLTLSPESREIVMVNSRYGDALYVDIKPLSEEDRSFRFELCERSIAYADDLFYREAMPDYDWDYHVYRACQYISSFDMFHNVCGFTKDELLRIAEYGERVEQLWLSDPERYGEYDSYSFIHSYTLRNKVNAGLIPEEEYRDHLLEIYEGRNQDRYDSDAIFINIDIPREYIGTLDREGLSWRERSKIGEMYRSAVSYVFNTPGIGTFYELMDYYAPLLFGFRETPEGMSFEQMGLQSFAAFHPPTYIHSMMVAQISLCLTEHLIEKQPELFTGIMGTKTAGDVRAAKADITDFVYHAALCHDFGKLIVIDTVFIYGRKILDFEFDIIRQHPSLGALMLRMHHSTKKYADIAEGHHRWYNGKGGYPGSFSSSESEYHTLIDIVTVADCMDAATDSVGRSYNRGKTFEEFRDEVKKDAGVRYAPYLAELLYDEELGEEIRFILDEYRGQAYLDTYNLLRGVRESGR